MSLNNDKKFPRRDLGKHNVVRREHLDLYDLKLPSYIINDHEVVKVLQRIIDNIKLSYYTDGYYNGRARAFEDVIDLIKEIIENSYENEDE